MAKTKLDHKGKGKLTKKRKRELLHELLDEVIDCNGFQQRQSEKTGNKPTAFFEFSGHVARISVRVHPQGFSTDNYENFFDKGMYLTNEGRYPSDQECNEENFCAMIDLIKNAPTSAGTQGREQ